MNRFLRNSLNIFAASVYTLSVATAAWSADSISFPGKVSEIKSPDGLFEISSVDGCHKSGSQIIHQLYVRKVDQNSEQRLRKFSRSVDILWCPNSSAFVVNDWAGSNTASSYLYRVGDLMQPTVIGEKLNHFVRDLNDRKTLTKSEHLYIIATKWNGPDSLEVKATGHDDETGKAFTLLYKWDLRDSFEKTSHIDEETPTKIEQPAN